jgi:NAD+ kinase
MKIGIIVNYQKIRASKVLNELIDYLKQKHFTPLIEKEAAQKLGLRKFSCDTQLLIKEAQLIVALGGDGTILKAARIVKDRNIPILGINLGSLGFLTLFSYEKITNAMERFVNNECRIEKRLVLEINYQGKKFYALNDCTINMGPDCRVIELSLWSNQTFICRLVGDGVIIATPTGSTAYSLACGGPIVFPTLNVMLITPISPHILSSRPIVVPDTEKILVKLTNKNKSSAILGIDGQVHRKLKPTEEIQISKSPFSIYLVAPNDKSYYDILRTKMKWTEREDLNSNPK